jgi:hypothetical protein
MGVPISEVGYTSATTGRGDHEVHKGHAVASKKKNIFGLLLIGSKTVDETSTGNLCVYEKLVTLGAKIDY